MAALSSIRVNSVRQAASAPARPAPRARVISPIALSRRDALAAFVSIGASTLVLSSPAMASLVTGACSKALVHLSRKPISSNHRAKVERARARGGLKWKVVTTAETYSIIGLSGLGCLPSDPRAQAGRGRIDRQVCIFKHS